VLGRSAAEENGNPQLIFHERIRYRKRASIRDPHRRDGKLDDL
jgi:hypothetical protein